MRSSKNTSLSTNHFRLILRLAVADPTAQCPLATKFGCDPEVAEQLLRAVLEMGMDLVGISSVILPLPITSLTIPFASHPLRFHVGSGCRDPSAFRLAIAASKKLFELGASMGHRMHLLDIGGGFPGHDTAEITFGKVID